MLSRQKQIRIQVQKLMDAGLFSVGFWLAHWIRANWLKVSWFGGVPEIQKFEDYSWLLLIIFPIGPFLLEMQGFYNRPVLASRASTIWQAFKGCFLSVIVVVSALFLLKEMMLSRGVIISFGFVTFGLLLLKEELLRRWLESSLGQAQLKKRVILVGTPGDASRLKRDLKQSAMAELEIVSELNFNEVGVEELVEQLHLHSANGVLLSAQHTAFGKVERAIQACEMEGVEAWLLADFFKTEVSQTSMDEFQGRPMLVFRTTPPDSWQNLAKQVIDVLGALILVILLSPLMLLATIWIKLSSPGPVLFRQERSGLNGRPFTMMKFRSMVNDAEQRKQELAALNEMSGPVFKVSDDPRVTTVGRFLRRYSIDELPQLINVLRGEMSLVGPRPLPVDEVKRFDDLSHRRRLSVKPGLTCLWQVSGRNNVTNFQEWVRLDLEYIDNWSLWLDLKILFRTIPVVFLGTGAK